MENGKMSGKNLGILRWMISSNPGFPVCFHVLIDFCLKGSTLKGLNLLLQEQILSLKSRAL